MNPSVPACAEFSGARAGEKVHILSHDCGPEIQELLKAARWIYYRAGSGVSALSGAVCAFEALMGQRLDQDTYVTACPILNSESI